MGGPTIVDRMIMMPLGLAIQSYNWVCDLRPKPSDEVHLQRQLKAQVQEKRADIEKSTEVRSIQITLNSVIMNNPANTQHLRGVSGASFSSKQELDNNLVRWKNSLSISSDRLEHVNTAVSRIRKCIENRDSALNLSGLKLPSLPSDVLENIRSLRELDISDSTFSHVDASIFERLETLTAKNTALKSLDLSRCLSLRNIHLQGSQELRNLTFPPRPIALRELNLDLSGIRWKDLPREVKNGPGIYIDVSKLTFPVTTVATLAVGFAAGIAATAYCNGAFSEEKLA
jgi:hypothetical protein